MIGVAGLPYSGSLSDRDVRASTPAQTMPSPSAPTLSEQGLRLSRVSRSLLRDAHAIQLAHSWVSANLDPLLELPHNWDSYGASPVQEETAAIAERTLIQLLRQGVTPPSLFPTPDGGISLDWRTPSIEFALHFRRRGEPLAYFLDEESGEEWEEELATAMPQVREILTTLADGDT